MLLRRPFVLLAVAALVAGCGARAERAGETGIKAPGVLVFSGFGSGSYLHAIRPAGTGLRAVELPKTCSPKGFSRDGKILMCDEWTDWGEYAVERRGGKWQRVPLPRESRQEERIVVEDAEMPNWSPDGTRLAFARCGVTRPDASDGFAKDSTECSIWIVLAGGREAPEQLVDKTDSAPVWSPDGEFIAFFREMGPCGAVCKQRIFIVPSEGGESHSVGPDLIEPSGLYWIPDAASALELGVDRTTDDELDLQRCADIWNRAHMQWPTGAANVSTANERCQVTVAYSHRDAGFLFAGFNCSQPVPFSFQCPSHAGQLRQMNPQSRVWNAEVEKSGKLTLFNPPKGSRLPLPKAPPYPLLNGYVVPFGGDGQLRPGLTFAETVTGTCMGRGDIDHPDSVRCGWDGGKYFYFHNSCFKAPGRLRVGDVVLCGEGAGSTRFVRLKLSNVEEPLD